MAGGIMLPLVLWGSYLGLVGSAVLPKQYYGEVTSPNYPKAYPNDNVSSWDIVVPEGFFVKLSFWQFDLEPSETCHYDYVKVSADKKDLGRYCGQVDSEVGNHPGQQEFVSRGNRMRLQFSSDFSNEENGTTIYYKGFLAYYQAVDRDECAETDDGEEPPCHHLCHNYVGSYFCSCRPGFKLQSDRRTCKVDCSSELFMEETGYISSPGYPSPYPEDLRCNYSIRIEKGLNITLKFLDTFEIDDHQQVRCPYDTLKIQAGQREIGTYCGRQSPGLIHTHTHAVDLLFTTDNSGDSRGWKVHYTSERIRCPQPVPLDKFSTIRPMSADYRFQDYIIVSCDKGYKLMEGTTELRAFTAICQNDGTWHRPLPRCEIVSCKRPPELVNGRFTYQTKSDTDTYQSVIKYGCNEPYYDMLKQSGDGTYTCTAERVWKDDHGSAAIPQCLPVCGKPENPITGTGKIIGGEKAQAGAFPWQVLLHRGNGHGGGALIGDHWILTAAHVIYPKNHNKMDLGEIISELEVSMGHIDVTEQRKLGHHEVENITVHPNYTIDEHNFDNDIALIKLKQRVTMNANIMPICLPQRGNETLYDTDQMGYVSGFGVTEMNTLSSQLRYVRLPVVSPDTCREYLTGKTIEGKAPVFSSNMYCAGFPQGKKKNKDSCQGDSGGAFTIEDLETDRWMATGIISWGIGCGKGYGFYTKVINYGDWMEEVMKGQPPPPSSQ